MPIYLLKKTKDKLEKDIKGTTGGHELKVFQKLLEANRDESQTHNQEQIKKDTQEMFKRGEKRVFATDDNLFIQVMTKRTVAHLMAMDSAYAEWYSSKGKGLIDAIKNQTSGFYKTALVALAKPWQTYFAQRMYKALTGVTADYDALIYILVIHDPQRRAQIAGEYERIYKKNMARHIGEITSGPFRLILATMATITGYAKNV